MDIILPIVGSGSRFAAEGYVDPKPLIPVRGEPMVSHALRPIPEHWRVHAPCRREQLAQLQSRLPSRVNLIPLPGMTEGAACTVLSAALALPPNDPVAVMNADQTFTSDLTVLQQRALNEQWDGYILTFCATDDRWSYVRTATDYGDDWVREVAEKQVLGTHATVGFYWFRRAGDLVWACAQQIAQQAKTRGEYYLAPVYSALIARGARVRAVPVAGFVPLGTPDDVRKYEGQSDRCRLCGVTLPPGDGEHFCFPGVAVQKQQPMCVVELPACSRTVVIGNTVTACRLAIGHGGFCGDGRGHFGKNHVEVAT